MWLKDTEPVSISDNLLTVKVIDEVTRRHIAEQYLPKISMKLKEITGQNFVCELVLLTAMFLKVSRDAIVIVVYIV